MGHYHAPRVAFSPSHASFHRTTGCLPYSILYTRKLRHRELSSLSEVWDSEMGEESTNRSSLPQGPWSEPLFCDGASWSQSQQGNTDAPAEHTL